MKSLFNQKPSHALLLSCIAACLTALLGCPDDDDTMEPSIDLIAD